MSSSSLPTVQAPLTVNLESIVKKVLRSRVYDVARETPISEMPILSKRFHNNILIKREDMQPVFSFKCRGAYNKMCQLSKEALASGVIAASAGNHAQGLALAAQRMGCRCIIVMPIVTPSIKVDAVRARGATVILQGDNFDEAAEYAKQMVVQESMTYIPPYDDIDVIAGQGTIGMEILRQYSQPIDAIFVPVGGGGLIAGIMAYVKYLRPEIKVIAVEAEDSACLKAALDAGHRVTLDEVGVFAEGVAVKVIGEVPFRIIQPLVDGMITVSTDEICAAVKDAFDDTRSVAETAGAVSLAGLKKYVLQHGVKGQTLICINSGANTNFDRLQHIAERTELGEQREVILAVKFSEERGAFLKICKALGGRKISECNYRWCSKRNGFIYLGVSVEPGGADRVAVVKDLESYGYEVYDLTDNELAKLHIRHLGGGRATFSEQVYRFEFPERPRSLPMFLERVPVQWNLTLFHYRNHGTAYGRVLVAFQVPENEVKTMEDLFDKVTSLAVPDLISFQIGHRYWRETDNEAWGLFMATETQRGNLLEKLTSGRRDERTAPPVVTTPKSK